MLENLERHKEQQQQQRQTEDEQSLKAVLQLANTESKPSAPVEPIQPVDIELEFSVGFAKTFEKAELDELQLQRKRMMETMNDLSRMRYLGVQVQEQKVEKKQGIQTKKEGKQVDKKANQEVTKKDQPIQQTEKTAKEEVPPPPQSRFKLSLLMEAGVQKFQPKLYKRQIKSKGQFADALKLAGEVIEAISFLNDNQYTIYPATLEEILVVKNSRLKLAFHSCNLWRTISQQQLADAKAKEAAKFKKQSMLNPSLRYTSPEFILKSISLKDIRQNDIWKTGLMVLTLLSGEDLSKDILALQSVDEAKLKEFKLLDEGKMGKLRKYMRNEDVGEIMKMVALQPAERPPLRSFLPLLSKLKEELSEQVTPQTLKLAQEYYQKERNSKTFKFQPQLKANQELMTADHKKKISEYFKTNQNRIPKEYRLIYRASQTIFSCKAFYQVAYERRGLLIAIQQRSGKRLICYSEEVFDLSRCVGVFGGWVKDTKRLSFIYSPQENEFCKLKNAERAIGVSHIQGPIIGDGDLVISDGGLYNICRFPSSYQSLKLKRLLKSERFQLQEYDVYQVLF